MEQVEHAQAKEGELRMDESVEGLLARYVISHRFNTLFCFGICPLPLFVCFSSSMLLVYDLFFSGS